MVMFEDAQLSFGSTQAACEHSGKPHQHEHEQVACACCSPVFATMQSAMKVTDLQLRDADHWRPKGRDLPEVATHTQVFINAKILTMDDGGNEADAMAIKDGKIVAAKLISSTKRKRGENINFISAEWDDLKPSMGKQINDCIKVTFAHICNQYFKTGILPGDFQYCPYIMKSGD